MASLKAQYNENVGCEGVLRYNPPGSRFRPSVWLGVRAHFSLTRALISRAALGGYIPGFMDVGNVSSTRENCYEGQKFQH